MASDAEKKRQERIAEIWKSIGRDGPPKLRQGFAAMDPAKVRAAGRTGGKMAQKKGTAHRLEGEEAREAGRKGAEVRWARFRAERMVAEKEFLAAMKNLIESGGGGDPFDRALAMDAEKLKQEYGLTHKQFQQAAKSYLRPTVSSKAEELAARAQAGREGTPIEALKAQPAAPAPEPSIPSPPVSSDTSRLKPSERTEYRKLQLKFKTAGYKMPASDLLRLNELRLRNGDK